MKNFTEAEVLEKIKNVPFVPYSELKRIVKDNPERNELALKFRVSFQRGAQSIEVSLVPLEATWRERNQFPDSKVNFVNVLRQVGVFDTDAELLARGGSVEQYIQEILQGKYGRKSISIFPLLSSVDEYGVTYFSYNQKKVLLDELCNLFDAINDPGLRSDIAELARFILPLAEHQKVAFWGD